VRTCVFVYAYTCVYMCTCVCLFLTLSLSLSLTLSLSLSAGIRLSICFESHRRLKQTGEDGEEGGMAGCGTKKKKIQTRGGRGKGAWGCGVRRCSFPKFLDHGANFEMNQDRGVLYRNKLVRSSPLISVYVCLCVSMFYVCMVVMTNMPI